MALFTALLTALAGKEVQRREQEEALERKEKEVLRGKAKARRKQRQASKEVQDVLEKFAPEARTERRETLAGEQEQRILEAIGPIETKATGEIQDRVSDAVLAQRAENVRDLANRASVLAALKGKLGSYGSAMQEERQDLVDLVGTTSDLAQGAEREVARAATLADLVEGPDKKRMLAGGLMEGLGLSTASGEIMSALKPTASKDLVVGGMSTNPYYKDPFANVRSIQ